MVVYTSTDQVFSEPVLKKFEEETGIEVKAIFDTEETKSTGLVNRLIAEKNRPKCDVFWSNDVLRVEILKQKGILSPYYPIASQNIPKKFKDPRGYGVIIKHGSFWKGFGKTVFD